MILVITPERTIPENAYDRSGMTGIGRGDPPRVRQSVKLTEHHPGQIDGFSKVVLYYQVVSSVLG